LIKRGDNNVDNNILTLIYKKIIMIIYNNIACKGFKEKVKEQKYN